MFLTVTQYASFQDHVFAAGVVGPILHILEYFLQERSLKVVLYGQSSPLYITNTRVPQGSVFRPSLLLVFINDLHNEVLSRIGTYCRRHHSIPVLVSLGFFEKVESAGELELELCSILPCLGKRQYVPKKSKIDFLPITVLGHEEFIGANGIY